MFKSFLFLLLAALLIVASSGDQMNPDNLLLGCAFAENDVVACPPVPLNAHFCQFPLECAKVFLDLQPIDAVLWQPLFSVEGNLTFLHHLNDFEAELSGATYDLGNSTFLRVDGWDVCRTYDACMYRYLDMMTHYDRVLFRKNDTSRINHRLLYSA
jgi:hypothetical protein